MTYTIQPADEHCATNFDIEETKKDQYKLERDYIAASC